jgi:hypothetical protein
VALQVQQALARDVADLLDLERAQGVGAAAEGLDVVEAAADVDRDALVPEAPVVIQARVQGLGLDLHDRQLGAADRAGERGGGRRLGLHHR